MAKEIDVRALKTRLDEGDEFVFVDVREPYEFEEYNLGADLIPLGSLPERLEDLGEDKASPIIVHCRSGKRSAQAQRYLESQGYSDVTNVTGGVLAWREAFPEQ